MIETPSNRIYFICFCSNINLSFPYCVLVVCIVCFALQDLIYFYFIFLTNLQYLSNCSYVRNIYFLFNYDPVPFCDKITSRLFDRNIAISHYNFATLRRTSSVRTSVSSLLFFSDRVCLFLYWKYLNNFISIFLLCSKYSNLLDHQ